MTGASGTHVSRRLQIRWILAETGTHKKTRSIPRENPNTKGFKGMVSLFHRNGELQMVRK